MLLRQAECALVLQNLAEQRSLGKLTLKEYKLAPAVDAVGYLGDYYYLTLSFVNENAQCKLQSTKLFVKTLPLKSDEEAKVEIFCKETRLYESLLPALKKYSTVKWFPACYYVRDDLLVLEDLHQAGFAVIKQPQGGLDDANMRRLLHALAVLHAASLNYEHAEKINILTSFGTMLQEITISPDIAWYVTGMRALVAIIKQHAKYQSSFYQDFIATQLPIAMDSIYAMTSASAKYRNVLCHRDSWAANALVSESTHSAILIDFQTCRYAPPCIDVLFALYLNLSRKDRRLKEFDYIDWYYHCLAAGLQAFGLSADAYLPQAEVKASYEEFRLIAAVYRAVVMTIIKVPISMVTNEFKYVDRSKIILKLMQSQVDFREVMHECAEDVMELVLKLNK